MKRLASCGLVLAAVCATAAQGLQPGTKLRRTYSSSSDCAKNRLQVSVSAVSEPAEATFDLETRPPDRIRSQFTLCLEDSFSTTRESIYPEAPWLGPPPRMPSENVNQSVIKDEGFNWSAAIKQSLLFLGVQHGYAMTQPKTRSDLKGPFVKDYLRSVKSLHGWGDGGKFFTNYIAHPLEGSLVGFIQIQNDPKGMGLRLDKSGAYWRSRLKAFAWTAAWSTQFEIGPISQASIGNVGLHGKQTYVDLVITPTAGLGLLIAEDALDKSLIHSIERNSKNLFVTIIARMLFNPTRTAANILRFKKPWHRDPGLR